MSDELFNLRTAKEAFDKHGFVREHQLRLIKVGPTEYSNEILRASEYATTASIPDLTREGKEVPFAGSRLKQPGQLQIGAGTTTIGWRGSESFIIRNTLEKWAFADGNPLTGSGNFCTGPDATIQFVVVNNNGQPIRGYEFVGVFIENLGEMPFNNESDNIINYDCSFGYSFWEPLDLGAIRLDFGDKSPAQDKTELFDEYEKEIERRDNTPAEC